MLPYLRMTAEASCAVEVTFSWFHVSKFGKQSDSQRSPYCLLRHHTEVEHFPITVRTIDTIFISPAAPPQYESFKAHAGIASQ